MRFFNCACSNSGLLRMPRLLILQRLINACLTPVCNYSATPIHFDWLYLVNGDRAFAAVGGSLPPTLPAYVAAAALLLWEGHSLPLCLCMLLLCCCGRVILSHSACILCCCCCCCYCAVAMLLLPLC